jgi:hypothetical protein
VAVRDHNVTIRFKEKGRREELMKKYMARKATE